MHNGIFVIIFEIEKEIYLDSMATRQISLFDVISKP